MAMRCACWIIKATNTHWKCVILIVFRRQKWLCERKSALLLSVNCLSFWEWTGILFPVTLRFRPQPDRSITLSAVLAVGFSEDRSVLWLGVVSLEDHSAFVQEYCWRLIYQNPWTRRELLPKLRRNLSHNTLTLWSTHTNCYLEITLDFTLPNTTEADPSGRAVYGVGLRPLACWDCGLESHRGHGFFSVVSVVFCQVES